MRFLAACALLVACKSEEPGIRRDRSAPLAASSAPVPSNTHYLVGRYRADSGRELEAREKDGLIEFHVSKPAQWGGAYAADEIRFTIRDVGSELLVTDRYRPFDLEPGVHYEGEAGRAACLSEITEDAIGSLLFARFLKNSLIVDFARVKQVVTSDPASLEVLSCGPPVVTGVLRQTLTRVQSP